jgi:hypothetical protein
MLGQLRVPQNIKELMNRFSIVTFAGAILFAGCAAKKEVSQTTTTQTTTTQTAAIPSVPAPARASIPAPESKVEAGISTPLTRIDPSEEDCANLPPLCSGMKTESDLTPQNSTVNAINAAYTKYAADGPPKCRFIQPPKCYFKQKRTCKQECTP